jgi:hypothetical protein
VSRGFDAGNEAGKGGQRALDQVAGQPSYDEDDARAVVIIRPFRQVIGRVNEMLNAMDHNWATRCRHIQHSLHPQHVTAVTIEQHCQPDTEDIPVHPPLVTQAEGVDVGAMAVVRYSRPLVFDGQPLAHLLGPPIEIIEITGQQQLRIERGVRRALQLRSDRVNLGQAPSQCDDVARVGDIGLGDNDAIGDRNLLRRFLLLREMRRPLTPSIVVTTLPSRK